MDDEANELDDQPENDEHKEDPSEILDEPDELDEGDDELPEIFDEDGEFDDIFPEIFGETDEENDDIPEIFGEVDEDDSDLPEIFGEVDEDDSDLPEIFGESAEIEDDLNDTIQEREESEETNENQATGDEEDVYENNNSNLTTTVLMGKVENSVESQEQEEEIEEVRHEVNEESENLEEINEAPEELTSTEEFEYLWNVREKLDREGKSEDEIEEVMHEAEEMYKTLKEAENLYEQQEQEKLKQVNHDGEATNEDLKEEIDRVDLVEQAVEIEEKLAQQGIVQEEIDEKVEEAIEITELEEELEKVHGMQEQENLKQIDHDGEANNEDLKEDVDRVDLVEQAVEIEENLTQQGKSQEEIDREVEKAMEMSELNEEIEKLYEEQQQEKIRQANLEEDESIESTKEVLDRADLVERAVELEEDLAQQGKSQEEIDREVEKAMEMSELNEEIEKLYEEQQREKIRQANLDDEESEVDPKEEIDRPAEVEYYVEKEEELHQQGIPQEEVDEQMEEIANEYEKELTGIQEKEEEPNATEELKNSDIEIKEQNSNIEQSDQNEQTSSLTNEKKTETSEIIENNENVERITPELETIENESEEEKEKLEDDLKKVREKTKEEEEDEHLQELYRQETGKRPIYSGEKTKGYTRWLEERELKSEKIQKSQREREAKEEIEEEGWKTTLKRWIREASEDECSSELKSELRKALERYKEFEYLTKKLIELYEKAQHENLSEEEKSNLKSLIEKLQQFDPVQIELLANIRAIKIYINEHGWELMNRFREIRVQSRFFEQISQKYENLKKEIKSKELWMEKQKELSNDDTGSEWDNCYGVIYLLTDTNIDGTLPNKIYYIGVTIRKLRRRFLEHISSTENRYLKKALNRYHKKFKVDTISESFSSTDGSEFTIEIIDTAKDFIELGEKEKSFINKYKTFIYDHFVLINNEPIPLYGYNLTRGGFSKPVLYGFLSPKYINIPRDDFKKIITLGYRTEEIACEFNIALSTVHAKIIEFWGDQGINNINSARKAFGGWDSFKSRGNIDVNLEELIQLIEDGAFMHEICEKLGVSRIAVVHRLEQLGASDLTHARFIFGGTEIYKKRLKGIYKQTLFKYGKGELNYQYILIPRNELKKLIEKGLDEFKIAELYNTSNVTVRARVKEHWGITFFEAVLLFRIFKMIDESYLETLIQERLSIEEIERLFYIKLISQGHTPTSISKYFDFKRPAISNRIKKSLWMTFNDAQDIYFYKPRIIAEIKNGSRNAVDIANLLGVKSHTIVTHMKRIWHSEFLNLYDSNYPKNSPRHFNNLFRYLIQFYNENN